MASILEELYFSCSCQVLFCSIECIRNTHCMLVEIPDLKLFIQNILSCIPIDHEYQYIVLIKHNESKHWGRSHLNPTTLVGYLCS